MQGIVTLVTDSGQFQFRDLADRLAKSITENTNLPVSIFQCGKRDALNHSKIFSRTTPNVSEYHNTPHYMKARCCLLSGFDEGWWLDSDMIVTPRFSEIANSIDTESPYPRMAYHHEKYPTEITPAISRLFGDPDGIAFHACAFTFSQASKPFLELYDIIVRGRSAELQENRGFDEQWWICMLRRWSAKPLEIDILHNQKVPVEDNNMPHIYHGHKTGYSADIFLKAHRKVAK